MKKSLLVISVILLIAGLFISCNSEVAGNGSELAEVTFADNSKALSTTTAASSDSLIPVDNLYWWYKATKTSAGGTVGQTSWKRVSNDTGLEGTIGKFSLGKWTFDLVAVDEYETTPTDEMYSSTEGLTYWGSASVRLTSGTNSIPVTLSRHTPAQPITVQLVDLVLLNNTYAESNVTWTWKAFINDTTAEPAKSGDIIMSTTGEKTVGTQENPVVVSNTLVEGVYTIYIKVYDDSETPVEMYSAEKVFVAFPGATITVSGSLDELTTDENTTFNPTLPQVTSYAAYKYNSTSYNLYSTFASAVEAAESGDTVVLLKDVTYDEDYSVAVWSKNFSLDLNGHTFTTNSTVGITDGNNGYKAAAICYGDESAPNPARTVTVSNGVINTAYGAGIYADGLNLTLVVEDVTINAAQVGAQSTLEYSSAIRLTGKANVVINSGSFTAAHAGYSVAVSNSGGNVTINGGSFSAPLYFSTSTDSGVAKTITITGGAFTNFSVANSDKGTIAISGGTFDADPTVYVDTTSYNVSHSGSTWTVTPKN